MIRRQHVRLVAIGAVGIGLAATAVAQEDPLGVPPGRPAFELADTDGDGLISEAELARDAAAAFSSLDANRDRRLSPEELGGAAQGGFAEIDVNGDGLLTFEEVMRHKTQAFELADKNGDGRLSYEEMTAAGAAR
jgi:Ca2+-binding EF-hand superfamily protein